ncbi:hypothetical protein DL96DRAFT_364758 [Flagelloscypha sp. PMI_526]|nr:hypothetical protein DL96DRAFT_364758 [Flagelloscypha sp. PMI_526]
MTAMAIELLENIITFLDDDFPTLAACSLTCSILLPACRAVRFRCVTLYPPTRVQRFHRLLQDCPEISSFIIFFRLVDPQEYRSDNLDYVSQILHTLERVVKIQIIGGPNGSVWWGKLEWLIILIEELPNLQSVVVDVWTDLGLLSGAPFLEKITGIGLFYPAQVNIGSAAFKGLALPHRPLSMLRLASLSLDYTPAQLLYGTLGIRQDLSHLRSLALCLDIISSSTATWLTAILPRCSSSLENLALELCRSPKVASDLIIPEGRLPALKSVLLTITYEPDTRFILTPDNLQAWLLVLMNFAPKLQHGQVTIAFLCLGSRGWDFSTDSIPNKLLSRFVEVMAALHLCQKVVCIEYGRGGSVGTREFLGIPESWIYKPNYPQVSVWANFYDL